MLNSNQSSSEVIRFLSEISRDGVTRCSKRRPSSVPLVRFQSLSRVSSPVNLIGCSPSCAREARRDRGRWRILFREYQVALRCYGVEADRPPLDRSRRPRFSTPCSRFDISGWRDRGLYPLVQGRRGARGESTESMTRGGGHFFFAKIGAARPARAADFVFANSAAGRSMALELFAATGRCTSAPAASERAGGLYAILSLRHFRLARSWSLSLNRCRVRVCDAGWNADVVFLGRRYKAQRHGDGQLQRLRQSIGWSPNGASRIVSAQQVWPL